MKNSNVCVVIVTYGDRWHFLSKVVERLLKISENFSLRIIVVDNTLTQNIAGLLEPINNEIHVVTMGRNTGSAAGFGAGIQYAVDSCDCNFLWLLDDDNLPDNDSLSQLFCEYENLGKDPNNALASMRDDRAYLKDAILKRKSVRLQPNTFLDFSVRSKILNFFRRADEKKSYHMGDIGIHPCVEMDYAPYGGFFFHRSWVSKIGIPRKEYFVYVDDQEYTHRILQNGGRIYLTPKSSIHDLECSDRYTIKAKNIYTDMLYSGDKVFHEIKNKVHFENSLHSSKPEFYINLILYTAYIVFLTFAQKASFRQKISRASLILRAISTGLFKL